MSISVCPTTVVAAPIASVWSLISNPASYSAWWDATTTQIVPAGPAIPGQIVYATSRAFGRSWPVNTTVLTIDPDRHAIDLRTMLPFGITVQNHITCLAVDAARCRVAFG